MSVDSTLHVNKRTHTASFLNQGSLKIFTGKRKLTLQTAYLSRTKVRGQDFKKRLHFVASHAEDSMPSLTKVGAAAGSRFAFFSRTNRLVQSTSL